MTKTIAGVNVETDAPDLKNVKGIKSLQKLKIFSHLDGEEKANAEKELLDTLSVSPDSTEQD